MDSNSFSKCYLIYYHDANSGLGSGKALEACWWSWIPNDTRGGIFCPTPEVQLHCFYITPMLEIPVESVFLIKLFLKPSILALYHDFHWVLVAVKFLGAKLHSLYIKESESEILERSVLESDISPRLRNPGGHTWMMVSISLVMVVQLNFCNQDFCYWSQILNGVKIWQVSSPIYHI